MRNALPIVRVERRCVYEDRGYETPCRIFTGCLNYGYGQVSVNGTPTRTHRITYEHYVGPIPKGLEIDHLCRQRDCCEVTHLEAVTRSVNVRRGTAAAVLRAKAAARTHCAHGHEFAEHGRTYISNRRGRQSVARFCRVCLSEHQRRYRERKAAT